MIDIDVFEGDYMYYKDGETEFYRDWEDMTSDQQQQMVNIMSDLNETKAKTTQRISTIFN